MLGVKSSLLDGLRRWNDYCETGSEDALFDFLRHAAVVHVYLTGAVPDATEWERALSTGQCLLPLSQGTGLLRILQGRWDLQTDHEALALRWSSLGIPPA